VRIEIDNLPAGFTFHGPIEIEAGQQRARGVLSATADAAAPDEMADKVVKVRAVAMIDGREVVQDLGTLGDIQLGEKPKVTIEIVAGSDPAVVKQVAGEQLEFTIRQGQTIKAKVRAERREFNERIECGRDGGADRNLPHGAFIDNLRLNGLLIVEGENERDFFPTAAPKTPQAGGSSTSAPMPTEATPRSRPCSTSCHGRTGFSLSRGSLQLVDRTDSLARPHLVDL
jgi:hypothetical protein